MPIISPVDGSIVDTGVANEGARHQVKESLAHQRSATVSVAGSGISIFAGWDSNWFSTWASGAELDHAPSAGDTTILVKYIGTPPPGSNGGTTTIGLGIGMSVTNATGSNHYAAGTTITGISGLTISISHPVASNGGSADISCGFSGLANSIYPTNWDACLHMNQKAGFPPAGIVTWNNYDVAGPGQIFMQGAGNNGGTDSGGLDSAGYELWNAPSHFSVNFTGGTNYGWGHNSADSLYTVIYPATTNGPNGPINSYLFDFGSSVTLSTKQAFSAGTYSGLTSSFPPAGLSVTGTSSGTNSSFVGNINIGDITVSFDLIHGFSCSVAGVIANNSGSTSAGWTCDFTHTFNYPFTVSLDLNNMSFDATFGKPLISCGIGVQLTS